MLTFFDLGADGVDNDDADDRYSDVSTEEAHDLSMDENAVDKILYPSDKN